MLIVIHAFEDCFYGEHSFYSNIITRVEDRDEAEELAIQLSRDLINDSDEILDILREGAYDLAIESGTADADLEDRVEELMEDLVDEDVKYQVYHIKVNEDQAIIDFYNYTDLDEFLEKYDHQLILSQ